MTSVEEFEAAGLLLGMEGDADRLQLLEWLDREGFSIDEMQRANATGSLHALAADRRIAAEASITRAEAIERTGLDGEQLDALAMAFGFTPVGTSPEGEIGFTAAELEVFTELRALSGMFSPEEALVLIRIIGSTFARLGEAVVSMFLSDIESPHIAAGEGELELARKVYETAGGLDGLTARLDPILRRHVAQAAERTRSSFVEEDRLRYRYAVGFVDLVGFTERSNDMSAHELAALIRDFEGRTQDVAIASGARVVKLIGDEVMFVATEPSAACRAAAALMECFEDLSGLVLPRGGLAYGEVLTRGGDYYGSVVNLASRLVDHAVPREVLATRELVEAAADACSFEPAGRRSVKGFQQPVSVWSLATIAPVD